MSFESVFLNRGQKSGCGQSMYPLFCLEFGMEVKQGVRKKKKESNEGRVIEEHSDARYRDFKRESLRTD